MEAINATQNRMAGDDDGGDSSGCPGIVHLRGGRIILAAYVGEYKLGKGIVEG